MSVQFPEGARKTRQRARILKILEDAPVPMTAAEIYAELTREVCVMSLSTVYRALEFFERHDWITKTVALHGDVAFYERKGIQHKHYAVCICCNKIVPLENCPLYRFEPQLADEGFKVLGHRMELYGYCGECEKNMEG